MGLKLVQAFGDVNALRHERFHAVDCPLNSLGARNNKVAQAPH